MRVLDLFSAAAGGWSLGLHRAGFQTVAACEWIDWRRALYAENNPGVLIYDDVRTLTGERLLADLGTLPDIVVGSPPCQDISSANTKGKGVDGERSGLFFEAVRIIGEVRPRWFALENSANLRTRGADRVLGELEGLDYACWAVVVGGDNIGANHERKRSWLIGRDTFADADCQLPDGWTEQSGTQSQGSGLSCDGTSDRNFGRTDGAGSVSRGHGGLGLPTDADSHPVRVAELPRGSEQEAPFAGDADWEGHASYTDGLGRHEGRSGRRGRFDVSISEDPLDPARLGHEGGWSRRHGPDGDGAPSTSQGAGSPADADQAGQADGSLVASLRQAEIAHDGCGSGRGDDRSITGQMGLRSPDRGAAFHHRADWSLDDLARHIRLDDGLPAWLAEQRIAVGGPRGTSAASLVVEAFGDAVLPQIPEAIGRAILRTEAALSAVYHQKAAA